MFNKNSVVYQETSKQVEDDDHPKEMDIDATVLFDDDLNVEFENIQIPIENKSSVEMDIITLKSDDNIINNVQIPDVMMNRMSGLNNEDGVSYYSNSVVQCLLSLVEYRQSLTDDNNFNRIMSYPSTHKVNDCEELRRYIGGIFIENQQQDAQKFLARLFAETNEQFLQSIRFLIIDSFRF